MHVIGFMCERVMCQTPTHALCKTYQVVMGCCMVHLRVCSLGDATSTDAYYEKALEVSNHRSARAKVMTLFAEYSCVFYLIKPNIVRLFSLNSVHWLEMHTTGVTMRSQKLFGKWQGESALALNSLYPDGWFALGAAALKARDTDKALDAFTRAVQIDPDNGEAWNNVACLHMIKKKSKAAFIAFKEALKFRLLYFSSF
ncbi:hypothetical protein B296_00039431 [Ensete ventricosum]|uniref:Uncharacterized protein n=1 Tax=Ensete ventricosum TaxID=4639 RepID=A0A426ZT96_ENSVE|nr:hypothetical protein B296_00039431 [Ensete ventricosum]